MRRVLLVLAVFIGVGWCGVGFADGDLSEIADEIKLAHSSIGSIEFVAEEYLPDDAGEPHPAKTRRSVHSAFVRGGEGFFRMTFVGPDGIENATPREVSDERSLYVVGPGASELGIGSNVTVSPRKAPGGYEGTMCSVLWLMLPCGRPIDELLDQGALLGWSDEAGGERLPELRYNYDGIPVRCVLDPEHDWLPRSVILETDPEPGYYIVERFDKVGGKWFPSAGKFTSPTLDGYREDRFRTLRFSYNEGVDRALFTVPELKTGGTLVQDVAALEQSIVGGTPPQLRRVFEEASRRDGSAATAELDDPPLAVRRGRLPASAIAVAGFLAILFGCLAYMWWQRERDRSA